MHNIDSVWVPEGTSSGQDTVWVNHLSLFSPASALSKVANNLCIVWDKVAFLKCLVSKGLSVISKQLALSLAKDISDTCAAHLIASASGGKLGPASIAIGTVIGMFTPASAWGTPGRQIRQFNPLLDQRPRHLRRTSHCNQRNQRNQPSRCNQ